ILRSDRRGRGRAGELPAGESHTASKHCAPGEFTRHWLSSFSPKFSIPLEMHGRLIVSVLITRLYTRSYCFLQAALRAALRVSAVSVTVRCGESREGGNQERRSVVDTTS